jgi:2'-5' RNA ligase
MPENGEMSQTVPGIRTFVCIEIPSSIRDRIGELQNELRRIDSEISWTRPSNIHLTLKFLGNVQAARIGSIRLAAERASSTKRQFDLQLGGAGCFPNAKHPNVLWVGVKLPQVLSDLQRDLEVELEAAGFPKEGRKFAPHLTIGRVRNPRNASSVAGALVSSGFAAETFRARHIIVMKSELKPTGSIYTPLEIIELDIAPAPSEPIVNGTASSDLDRAEWTP